MNKPDLNSENLKNENSSNEKQSSSVSEVSSLGPRPSKGARVFMAPRPGFKYNPLLKFPRNNPCPCKSGKKFKVCCLSTLPQCVTDQEADSYEKAMAQPGLTFITQKNKEEMKVAAEMHEYWKEQKRLDAEKLEKEKETK